MSLYRYIVLFGVVLLSCKLSFAQTQERWKLSVNNDRKPLEIVMDFEGKEKGVTYLFDITRDTLNMAFVAEEAIAWEKHGISVFAMPKKKEVLQLKLDDVDLENVQVVFSHMWKAMPKSSKNVTTLFELHEYGTMKSGMKTNHFIIRFKMKRPRQGNAISF